MYYSYVKECLAVQRKALRGIDMEFNYGGQYLLSMRRRIAESIMFNIPVNRRFSKSLVKVSSVFLSRVPRLLLLTLGLSPL